MTRQLGFIFLPVLPTNVGSEYERKLYDVYKLMYVFESW